MSIASIASTSSSNPAAAVGPSGQLGGQDFLQLLVMQLKNQDPLNPIDDQNFISQMAQLSSLQATNQVSSQLGQLAANEQAFGALALVGRQVEYTDAGGQTAQGKVTGLRLDASTPLLQIDSHDVPLDRVQTVL
jgi:flagellar basal-body rod modification protein FlgD